MTSYYKNTYFLLGIFVLLTIIFSMAIYYLKDEKERKKMKNDDIVLKCVIPSVIVGGLITMGIANIDKVLPKKNVYLDGDFWD